MVMKEKEREEDRALSNALRYSPYKVLLNTLECIMTPDDFGEWQSGQNTKVFVDEEDAVGREMKDLLVAEIVKQNKVSCPLCCTCEREQCSMVVHSWSLPFQNQTKMSGPSVYILALTVCLQQTGIENDARCQAWILDKSKGQQIYRPCKGKGGGRAYCPSHLGVGPWKPTVRQALVFMEEGKPGFDNDPRYVRKLAEESPLDYIAKGCAQAIMVDPINGPPMLTLFNCLLRASSCALSVPNIISCPGGSMRKYNLKASCISPLTSCYWKPELKIG
eukprot:scaffold108091_cov18-Tisochrysis_lutea.AAC.1